jgi:hypothetical protein
MTANYRPPSQDACDGAKPAWTEVWHFWNVVIPRRSITGKLVFGQVWRRHNGRHWIYKKFVEYEYDQDE